MTFDLKTLLSEHESERFSLYREHINPQLVRVLQSIGFDRNYVRGEGQYLYDADGRRYLDFLSGFGVYSLGRSHPVIKKALHDALDADLPNLVQLDAAVLPGVLATELLRRAPSGMGRVFFTNSGTEAVEAALKFARAATRRDRVVFCDHGFHGLTLGSLSINGGSEFRKGFGSLLPGFTSVPFGDAEALEKALQKNDVAAFVIEPIQGKGVNLASSEYWDSVQAACRRSKTLLVCDEVQTGLGRTGKLWAHEHWGIVPDIMTVSKALSGGFVPVGAMLCSSEVSDTVFSSMDRAVVHSSTFGKNQLAMVAALATLQTIDDEDLVDRARRSGDALSKSLQPLIDRYELFHEVRGKGLMIGLVFGEPASKGRVRMRYRLAESARKGLFSQLVVGPLLQRHGILTQVAADGVNIVKLLPPLITTQDDLDYFVEALDDVLASAHRDSSLFVDFGRTLVRGAVRRGR